MEQPGISLDDLLFQAFPSHSSNDYHKLTQTEQGEKDEEVTTTVVINAASTDSAVDNRLGEEASTLEIKDTTCLRVGQKVRTMRF